MFGKKHSFWAVLALITLGFSVKAAAPINDDCTIAATISDVTSNCFAIDMNGATFDIANGNCASGPMDVNIWYSFTAVGTLLDISMSVPGAQIALVRFTVAPCQLINAGDAVEDACATQIIPRTTVVVGQQYYILISAVDPSVITGNLCINNYDPPPNDDPCGAVAVTPNGPCVNGTTIGARPDYNVPTCPNNDIASVWYYIDLVAPNRDITISVESATTSTYSMMFGYFPADNCAATFTTFAGVTGDEYCGPAPGNIIIAGLQPGRYYYQLGTNTIDEGPFCTSVKVSPPPPGCATNELCANNVLIPTPTTPAPGVAPTPSCVDGCNLSAFPITSFTAGCPDIDAPTSWFRVTADAIANRMSIQVTGTEGMTNPQVAVFSSCWDGVSSPVPILLCQTGSGGVVTLNNLTVAPNTTYYLAVSNNGGPSGRFTICISTFFAGTACATNVSPITPISTSCGSPLNGPYIPGERVNFTYSVNTFRIDAANVGNNCQWLQGIVPIFGNGWDPASLTAAGAPVTTSGVPPRYGAVWQWRPEGTIDYNVSNTYLRYYTDPISGRLKICHISIPGCNGSPLAIGSIMPSGWFAHRASQGSDPDNTYGDGSGCNTNSGPWTVTFSLTARQYDGDEGCVAKPYTDCSVAMYTFADGEIGSWQNATCTADFPQVFTSNMVCQASVVDAVPDVTICSGGSFQTPQSGPFTIGGVPISDPVTWTVVAPAGVSGASAGSGILISGTLTNTSNSPKTVVYSVYTNPIPGCGGRTDVKVIVLPAVNVQVQANATTGCARSTFKLWAVVPGDTTNYNYSWSNGLTTRTIFITPNISGIYTVIVTDNSGSGCQFSGSIRINVNQLFPVVITMPDSIFCKEKGPKVMTATSLGQFAVQSYRWNAPGSLNNATTRTLTLSQITHTGIYTVTVTDVNGCTGTSSTEAIVNMAPNTFLSPNNTNRSIVFCRSDPDSIKRFLVIPSPLPGQTITWFGEYFGDETYGEVNIGEITSPHKLKIILTDQNGCISSDSLFIYLINPPQIIFGPLQGPFCASKSPVQLTATPPGGTWSGAASSTGIVDPKLLGPGRFYAVYSVSTGGCVSRDSFAFIVDPFPRAALAPAGPFCFNDPAYQLRSDSATGTWAGAGTTTGGLFTPSLAGVGTHQMIFTYAQRECQFSDTMYVVVKPNPVSGFTLNSPICVGQNSTLNYSSVPQVGAIYRWDFGGAISNPGGNLPGPHLLSWNTPGLKNIFLTVSLTGCNSSVTQRSVDVIAPTPIPTILCDSIYTTGIRFKWNNISGNSGYQIYVDNNLIGTITDTFYLANNLTPNSLHNIRVIVINNGPCGNSENTFQCMTLPCPNINIGFSPISTFCLYPNTAAFNLTTTITGGLGNGVSTYTGNGITNALLGTFDPQQAGVGSHNITLTYIEQACTFRGISTITIVNKPNPNFINAIEICQDSTTRITYNGQAEPPGSTFFWIFDGAVPATSNGVGPHDVYWTIPGTKNIRLVVNNGICSDTVSRPINVITRLPKPIITCNNTKRTITFSWNSVPGSTGYSVQVGSGVPIITLDTFYLISGLTEGESRFIRVFALGLGVCGNSVVDTLTCTAGFCPPVRTIIDIVNPVCLTATSTPMTLTYQLSGATGGSGTITWSGTGIVDPLSNTFSPAIAGPGLHKIYARFDANGGECTYLDSINILVKTPEFLDFAIPVSVCKNSIINITTSGALSPGSNASFDFGTGATPSSGNGVGPHAVSWNTIGVKSIKLTINNGVCTTDSIKNILVEDPLSLPIIACIDTFTRVTFYWNRIPGATGYNVVYQGNNSNTTDTFFVISNLNPNTPVSVQIGALGNNSCGNTSLVTATCRTKPCPSVILDVVTPDTICLVNGMSPSFIVSYALSGNGNGAVSWTSTPVNAISNAGVFNPTVGGAGSVVITAIYTEDVCITRDSVNFIIQNTPIASFNITNTACISDIVNITFSGNAPANAKYNWNFDGATVLAGTGVGPYTVRWNNGGDKTVSLSIADGQCISQPYSRVISIKLPLTTPEVTCRGYNDSISFIWPQIPGSTGYQIIVDNNPPINVSGTRYTATGLSVGTFVQVIVTAIGPPPCGNSLRDTAICKTNDCPAIDPRVDSVFVCYGAKDTLRLNAIYTPVAGNTFSWGPASLFQDTLNGIFNVRTAGVGVHRVTFYQRVRTCELTAYGYIVVKPVPIPQIVGNQTICKDSLVMISNGSIVPPGTTYLWNISNANIVSGNINASSVGVRFTTIGIQRAILNVSLNGCSAAPDTLLFKVEEPLSIPIIDCAPTLDSITFTWQTISGATGYQVFVGNNPVPIIQTTNTYTARGLREGDAVFLRVVAISGNTCGNSSDTITCFSKKCPNVSLSITGNKDVCLVNNNIPSYRLTINGTGVGAGRWTGTGVDSLGNFSPVTAGLGNHLITYRYVEDFCPFTASKNILIFPPPFSDLLSNNPSCFGRTDGNIAITNIVSAKPPVLMSFNGAPYSSEFNYRNLQPGIYIISLQDATGCESSDTITLLNPPPLSVDLGPDKQIFVGETVNIIPIINIAQGDSIRTFVWTINGKRDSLLNNLNLLVNPTLQSIYSLVVTNSYGCVASDKIQIIVKRDRRIFIPNVFSPNTDKANNVFKVFGGVEVTKINYLRIFNRWGELVYEDVDFLADNSQRGWDGYFRGKPMKPAVFVYVLDVLFDDGTTTIITGDLTLVNSQ